MECASYCNTSNLKTPSFFWVVLSRREEFFYNNNDIRFIPGLSRFLIFHLFDPHPKIIDWIMTPLETNKDVRHSVMSIHSIRMHALHCAA